MLMFWKMSLTLLPTDQKCSGNIIQGEFDLLQ